MLKVGIRYGQKKVNAKNAMVCLGTLSHSQVVLHELRSSPQKYAKNGESNLQPWGMPNILYLSRNGFNYKNILPYLDLAVDFLISCRSDGSAERTQIAKPSPKAVTFGTLNPLLTHANSLIAFCNAKQN